MNREHDRVENDGDGQGHRQHARIGIQPGKRLRPREGARNAQLLTPKSLSNHGILGLLSSFVSRMLPAELPDILAAAKYAFEVGFNEVDFSHCDFDARTRSEYWQRRHPGVKG